MAVKALYKSILGESGHRHNDGRSNLIPRIVILLTAIIQFVEDTRLVSGPVDGGCLVEIEKSELGSRLADCSDNLSGGAQLPTYLFSKLACSALLATRKYARLHAYFKFQCNWERLRCKCR
jgi:hypothetical protein